MSVFSDFVVYLWLLPVVAQILIPLGMLAFYLVNRLFDGLNTQEPIMLDKLASASR